jgi:hypothetical protein
MMTTATNEDNYDCHFNIPVLDSTLFSSLLSTTAGTTNMY